MEVDESSVVRLRFLFSVKGKDIAAGLVGGAGRTWA